MTPLIKLIRPLNCLMSTFSVLIILITLFGTEIQSRIPITILGMVIVFLFNGAGNVLNDYMDRKTDKTNHPERPIPSGQVNPETALKLSIIMFTIALALSLIPLMSSQFLPFLIVLIATVLIISYEHKYKQKGLPGNIIISALPGLLFIFAGSLYEKLTLPIIIGVVAFLSTIGREIVKDIQDMKGDQDRKTLPMRVGRSTARKIAFIFVITAIAISPLPYIFEILPLIYLIIVSIANITLLYPFILSKPAEKTQKIIKIGMMIALISFLIGGLLWKYLKT